MEIAFNAFMEIQPLLEKLKKHLKRNLSIEQQLETALTNKIITQEEMKQFLLAKKFQQDAMQVDAF